VRPQPQEQSERRQQQKQKRPSSGMRGDGGAVHTGNAGAAAEQPDGPESEPEERPTKKVHRYSDLPS
jgi:hypothetical protein